MSFTHYLASDRREFDLDRIFPIGGIGRHEIEELDGFGGLAIERRSSSGS